MAYPFYVYFLVDPRTGEIFYVGKGKGSRMSCHVAVVRAGRTDNPAKCDRIREIMACGLQVEEVKFGSYGSEALAYSVERGLIASLKEYGLTNIANGGVSAEEVAKLRIQSMKSRLKSFSHWERTAPKDGLEWARKSFGSPYAFYAKFCDELEKLSA